MYRDLRIRALHAVQHPTHDYFIRGVMRWFSKTFHTPLATVEEMPLDDLLQIYYEEKYSTMSEEEIEQERTDLLENPEQRYERILAEEAVDAETFEMSRVMAIEEEAARKKAAKDKKKVRKEGLISDLLPPSPLAPLRGPEAELVQGPLVANPQELPPGISMTFLSDEELEKELDGFGSMAPPVKK